MFSGILTSLNYWSLEDMTGETLEDGMYRKYCVAYYFGVVFSFQ